SRELIRQHRRCGNQETSLSAIEGRRSPNRGRNVHGCQANFGGVLDHRREANFLEAMATGKYEPELLFPSHKGIVGRIRRHAALLWKAENIRQYPSRRKLSK